MEAETQKRRIDAIVASKDEEIRLLSARQKHLDVERQNHEEKVKNVTLLYSSHSLDLTIFDLCQQYLALEEKFNSQLKVIDR